jgi:hypothetical protein
MHAFSFASVRILGGGCRTLATHGVQARHHVSSMDDRDNVRPGLVPLCSCGCLSNSRIFQTATLMLSSSLDDGILAALMRFLRARSPAATFVETSPWCIVPPKSRSLRQSTFTPIRRSRPTSGVATYSPAVIRLPPSIPGVFSNSLSDRWRVISRPGPRQNCFPMRIGRLGQIP